MEKIKAIFTDLDNTLLIDNFSTIEENKEAIRKAAKAGIKVIPATGRALGDIPKDILNMPEIEYIVLANGALVYEKKSKSFIFKDCMDKEKLCRLLSLPAMSDVCWFAMIDGVSHYQKSLFERIKGTEIYALLDEFTGFDVVMEDDLLSAVKDEKTQVEKAVIFFKNAEHMYNAVNSAPLLLDFDCSNSFEYNIEMTKKGVNKAKGIAFLCEKLGISPKETVTIGDSGNDVDMLKFSPNSYAVENAMSTAKQAAKFLTVKNTQSAVAAVIEKYLQ